MLLIAKILFLFITLWFGLPAVAKTIHDDTVSWVNFLVVSIGIVGFITCQYWLNP